jgi:hypothetical protein
MARSRWNMYRYINTVLIYVFYVSVYCAGYFIKHSCAYFRIEGFWLHMERLKILIQIMEIIPIISFALNFFMHPILICYCCSQIYSVNSDGNTACVGTVVM